MAKYFKFYAQELKSEECQCGKSKKSGMSFCYGCYSSLPNNLKKRLYYPLGNGYEEAYEEAVVYLN